MSLAQTNDNEALRKYQLSIRTTVPINSIASAKPAEPNSRLRRTLGRLCTFHNSKFEGDTKLTTDICIAKDPANAIAHETEIATAVADAHYNNQREPQTIEFTNGIITTTTTTTSTSVKSSSLDYYV